MSGRIPDTMVVWDVLLLWSSINILSLDFDLLFHGYFFIFYFSISIPSLKIRLSGENAVYELSADLRTRTSRSRSVWVSRAWTLLSVNVVVRRGSMSNATEMMPRRKATSTPATAFSQASSPTCNVQLSLAMTMWARTQTYQVLRSLTSCSVVMVIWWEKAEEWIHIHKNQHVKDSLDQHQFLSTHCAWGLVQLRLRAQPRAITVEIR